MPSIINFAPLILAQQFGRQTLARIPEPTQITNTESKVSQYDEVMSTKLVLAYAAGLMMVHRSRSESSFEKAIDLACGPGHYTICLARYLGYKTIVGVDLSPRMVDVANKNSHKVGLDERVQFIQGDVTSLNNVASASVDLSSFTDAAHHFPDLETVAKVLREMDRVTKESGLIMVMDLVRLRTAGLTERYVKLLGSDYVARGLADFYDDFRNSMFAAWTAAELRQAVPRDSSRKWYQIVPRGLPSTQIILGIPRAQKAVFSRSGFPWSDQGPVPAEMQDEWRILKTTLSLASCVRIGT